MSKVPIRDPTIKIVPSKELRKFIGCTLEISPSTPSSIRDIHTAFNTSKKGKPAIKLGTKSRDKFTEGTGKFTERELSLIRKLVTDDKNVHGLEYTSFPVQEDQIADSQPNGTLLTRSDINWLYAMLNQMRETDQTVPFLHELLSGSTIRLPENPTQERNPELEARCQRLRKEQADREYQRMTKNVDSVRKHMPEDTISYQMKQINRHMVAVAQFLFSVAAGFAFGFIGVELIVGQLDFGFRLLLGIIIALIIALAEIYFLAKKLNEEYELPPPPALVSKERPPNELKTGPIIRSSVTSGKEHHE
ncbi:uncharacterized protein LOC128728791 [Anopheles nili]|uniref:uncharacterized protein LOC128728791 n=1 Tax=Anopheles nili TaxID=185578 RepID=UPI00237B136E|nr:uncharacterized protein LOC128728791 [Anopheles nili]